MKKFIVTGYMRSGTTYLASVLNSQKNIFCLEDYPWITFPKKLNFIEDLLGFSNYIDSKFLYLGLPQPKLARNLKVNENILDLYISHLKKIFKSENVGFKKTVMTKADMLDRIYDGYKIIILKRNTKDIIKSLVNRTVNPDIYTIGKNLQRWLKNINYYSPDLPPNSYMVINYVEMIENLDKAISDLSSFLDLNIKNPTIRYHSFNKNRSTFDSNSSFFELFNKNRSTFDSNSSFLELNAKSFVKTLPAKYDDNTYLHIANQIDAGIFKPPLQE